MSLLAAIARNTWVPLARARAATLCSKAATPSHHALVDFGAASPSFPRDTVLVWPEFLSVAEEKALLDELQPRLDAKGDFEQAHMDKVIEGYRELEVKPSQWDASGAGADVIARAEEAMRGAAEPGGHWGALLPEVHVLELAAEGQIDAHVENTSFLGDALGGISLVSECVMRLREGDGYQNVGESTVDLLLPPRSLYVLFGKARYDYTHQITDDAQSWRGEAIPRARRVSLILRTVDPW